MLFRRKKPESASAAVRDRVDDIPSNRITYPKLYQGACLDLSDSGGNFLGRALLRRFSVHELDFIRTEGSLLLPLLQPGDTVMVSGRCECGEGFMLQTSVAESERTNLRLRDIALLTDVNRRSSARFFVNRPAELSVLSDDGTVGRPSTCDLVDISMEGGRVRSGETYELDDVLKLRVELYPNAGKISFRVQVVRKAALPDGRTEYGLLFEALPWAKRKYLAEDIRRLAERSA